MTLQWIALLPRDTVFVRDGRAFDAASQNSARSVRPWPSTVAGAVRALFQEDADRVCGPVLGRLSGERWQAYFPAPADLVTETGVADPYVFRLRSAAPPAGTETDLGEAAATLLAPPPEAEMPEPLPGHWVSGDTLAGYLAGELPDPAGTPYGELEVVSDPLLPEVRIGLARDGRKARTGYLYQAVHLRAKEGWAFLTGYEKAGWGPAPPGPVQVGGRGRLADVRPVTDAVWPEAPQRFPGGKVLVYVATPAIWPDGWRFPVPDGAELVAAACGEPEPVATTSPRQGWWQNRALRWAVPAGSVYLLEFSDADTARDWAHLVHGTAYGAREEEPALDRRLCTAGFGVVLTGVWE